MGQELRVVMVEDVENDAELAERELKRAGLAVLARRVEREEDFRREVGEFRPHVILSDFSMPQFNGMSALSIAREIVPDTPFIFVSGTLGEDYAIRALKNGATDYVLKSNLVRLPPTIERAVSEAAARAERRREEQLQALEHTVVRNIAGADSAAVGLKAIIRAICESEGWTSAGTSARTGMPGRCGSAKPGAPPAPTSTVSSRNRATSAARPASGR